VQELILSGIYSTRLIVRLKIRVRECLGYLYAKSFNCIYTFFAFLKDGQWTVGL